MGVLGSVIKAVLPSIVEIIGRSEMAAAEKTKLQAEIVDALRQREAEIEKTIQQEMAARERVLTAELQQGDTYTKRARPTVVYFGLMIIAFNYCFVPLVQQISGYTVTPFTLPHEFWYAWGGVVATWFVGRSAERGGFRNKLTSVITGGHL